MTDDDKALVQRLKGHSQIMERDKGKFLRFIDVATCTEAADRIEALSAEVERLLTLLRDCNPESMSWLDARDEALGEQ
jgi:hypothetical protein